MNKRELLAIAMGTVLAIYGVLSHVAEKASQKAAASQAVAQQAIEANKKFQQDTQAQIVSLQQSNLSLQNQLNLQKKKDTTLSPTDLSHRLETLTQAPQGSVLLEPTGHFDLSQAEILTVTQDLEALPVLNAQLKNTQQQLSLEQAAHKSDNDANTKEIKALNDEISSVKANARKSKLKWLAAGVVIGFVGRTVLISH